MKKISIILIVLIISLLIFFGIIGINVNKRMKPYKRLEEDIVKLMKVYYGQDTNLKKLPTKDNTHKVTIEELKEFGLSINNKVNNDECYGYGIVTGETVSHSYKAYIKCNNYTTKNFEIYK